jgi:hypothetical protein
MSSDEGGVGTVSSSVRRARSSCGRRAAALVVAGRFAVPRARPLEPAAVAAGRRLAAVPLFLAAVFFFTERRRPDAFVFCAGRAVFRRFFTVLAARLALRLAISSSFRNLDSFAISVVLSVAYRKSDSPVLRACAPFVTRRLRQVLAC